MRKTISVMIALFLVLGISGCRSRNENQDESQPSIETSIVYVYIDATDSAEEEIVETHPANAVTQGTVEETEATNDEEQIINEAISAAEEALVNRDYDTALSIIAAANHDVSDNTALINEQTRINSLRPVSLLDLNMFSGNPEYCGNEEISTGETTESIGWIIYDISSNSTLRTTTGISYATYGEYDTFTCRLALLNDCSKNSLLDCFIEVYCDGVLTYTSPSIRAGVLPIDNSTIIITVIY